MIVCPDPTPGPASVEDQTAQQWQDQAAQSVSTDPGVSPDYQGKIFFVASELWFRFISSKLKMISLRVVSMNEEVLLVALEQCCHYHC